MTASQSPTASRRGLLKGGAVGLGSITGAFALNGTSASAAPASMESAAQTGLAPSAMLPMIGPDGAADYYLYLDGIDGDSAHEGHKKWLDLMSYSWGGAALSSAATGAARTASRSTMSAMSLTTPFGSASPHLFIATMDGRHLPKATLEGFTAGENPLRFVRFDLVDVVITSYQTGASASAPSESFSLEFAKVTYTYWSQKPDGTLGEEVSVTWDSITRQAS